MVDPAPAGWSRVIVKTIFGVGRDFAVTDLNGQQVFTIDGKIGPRPKAEIQDVSGTVVYGVTGSLLGIPKKLAVSRPDGTEVAVVRAKKLSIKNRMTVSMTEGPDWHLEGNLIEKNYAMTSDGRQIAQISQKWIAIRDSYTLDVVDGIDLPLALAVLWAVDRFVEKD